MNGFPIKNLCLGIVGGVIGGAIGMLLCKLLADQGFYAIVLPGALVGFGFGYAARRRHVAFGIVSAVLGLIVTLVTEWGVIYGGGPSLAQLFENIKNDSPVTWILMGLGVILAFSFGTGRDRVEVNPSTANDSKE